MHRNLKDKRKYSSDKETVKKSNRIRPLLSKEDSRGISNTDLSGKASIEMSKVIKKIKEKKKTSILKSRAKVNKSKALNCDDLWYDWKKYFKKK